MMTNCIGCGIKLQTNNPKQLGYTPKNDATYCERCFRLKNYNEYKEVELNNINNKILEKINKDMYLTIFLVDILNINNETIGTYNKIKAPKILVISKKDIIEVLSNSEFKDYDDPLGLFLIGTILDKALYAHDVLSGVPEYKGTAAKRIDKYLETTDSAYITSRANARDYIELLTTSSIKYFLEEIGYPSVVSYDLAVKAQNLNQDKTK